MSLLTGLEKFGLQADEMQIYEKRDEKQMEKKIVKKEEKIPEETEFLLLKSVQCPVCEHKFKTISVKSGRLRRKEPDMDLRPRFYYIDTLKYDICACPKCGYTAMSRYFDSMSSLQRKLIKENVCDKFHAHNTLNVEELKAYDYDTAVERYKLSLYNSIVKKAKISEKAYTCLKLAWMLYEQDEELTGKDEKTLEKKAACVKEADEFYEKAYDGFVEAVANEMYPICGMDQNTLDCLLAAMAFRLKKYDIASKMISSILVSRTASSKMKDKALDMKEEIIEALKKEEQ